MIFNQLEEFGSLIETKQNKELNIKDLYFRYLGLYFTADWCGSCVKLSKFLPSLVSKINGQTQDFKLVTFRLDESSSEFANHFYKFKNAHLSQASHFADMLSIQFLPTILIYNLEGKLISRKGVQDMQTHG